MKHIVWVGLILSTAAAGGTAYKSIGPDGTVTFSDRPMPNAKEVRLPEPSTYAPPALPQGAGLPLSSAPPVSGGEYSGFAIAAPKNEETLHNRDRSVDVDLSLDPPLLEGHSFTLLLDGAELAKGLRTNRMRLTDLERGPHQLEATIYDASGQEVLRSQPIRFYLVTETLIKEPLEAQKEKVKDTLGQPVWDKWVQDLGQYGTKLGGDPLPKAAPPAPPVGSPPKGRAYDDALKTYQKASDRFDETHGTFKQPTVRPEAPYAPSYEPPAKPPSFVPAPPARPSYAPSYTPK